MSELDEFAKRIAACNCLNSKELSIKQRLLKRSFLVQMNPEALL